MARLKKKANVKQVNAYMNSTEWRQLAQKMIRLAGYRCQCCGVSCFKPPVTLRVIMFLFSGKRWKTIVLEVHHIEDISNNWHIKDDENNLIVMCFQCHRGAKTGFHSWMGGTRIPTNKNNLMNYFKYRKKNGMECIR